MPPTLTLGQEMFSSTMSTPLSLSMAAPSTYSSSLWPPRLAMATVPYFCLSSSISPSSTSMKCWTPGFCRPMLLMRPEGVSHRRSPLLPYWPCRVRPLPEMPPILLKSASSSYSTP